MTIVQILTSKEAIGVYALIAAGLEKKFQFIKPVVKFAESHKGIVKTAEQDVAKAANGVLHSPEVVALKAKADKLEKSVVNSDVYKVATATLHNLSVPIEQLTPETTNVVALTISNEVYRVFGQKVSVQDVKTVLNDFKNLAADVGGQQSVKSTEEVIAPKGTTQTPPEQPATKAATDAPAPDTSTTNTTAATGQ